MFALRIRMAISMLFLAAKMFPMPVTITVTHNTGEAHII